VGTRDHILLSQIRDSILENSKTTDSPEEARLYHPTRKWTELSLFTSSRANRIEVTMSYGFSVILFLSRFLAMEYSGLSRKAVLASRFLAMDPSGFQMSCHNIYKI
jgi:hypothetical protein